MAKRWQESLSSGRVYILPTKLGGLFILATFVILLIGSGYSNNLVNILAYFLLSLLFVAMVLTNLQVKGIELERVEVEPAYAGEAVNAQVILKNTMNLDRMGIAVRALPGDESGSSPTIQAHQNSRIAVWLKPLSRGRHVLSKLEISSEFPLGLFHAWKIERPNREFLVFPQPKGDPLLPDRFTPDQVSGESQHDSNSIKGGGEDFRGHRLYATGDSFRQVDWKAFARGRDLLVKEIDGGQQAEWIFEWKDIEHANIEAKLSQLALWVQQAYEQQVRFRMTIPGHDLAGKDAAHVRRCLEVLAEVKV